MAIIYGHLRVVEYLILSGHNDECKNIKMGELLFKSHKVLLKFAQYIVNSSLSNLEYLSLLILHNSAKNGYFEVVKYLIKNNVDPNEKNRLI